MTNGPKPPTPKEQPPVVATDTAHVELVDTSGMSPTDMQSALAQIADLKAKLGIAEEGRSAAEAAALAAAAAQGMLMQREIQEVATGKTVMVKRLEKYIVKGYHDDGREILRPRFKDVPLPTFFYKVDMPPCGGMDLKINAVPMFHGATYEVDIDTLRTMKDMIFRMWKHDSEIHGSDENAYRPKQKNVVSARQYG